jgi:hypothetical protein
MGKKGEKLGTNWGMSQIISIATAVFFVVSLVVMPSVLAYVTFDGSFGS